MIMKRLLQLAHLLLLLLAAILILLFKAWSVEEDEGRGAIDLLFYVVLGIWPVISLILLLLGAATPEEDTFSRLVRQYRKVLNNLPFLIVSNMIFLVVIGYLLVALLQYRQIEFTSNVGPVLVSEDVDPSTNDLPLGVINIGAPLKRRLKVADKAHELIFSYQSKDKTDFLRIKPAWENAGAITVQIKF
jgi:hypothetical protein